MSGHSVALTEPTTTHTPPARSLEQESVLAKIVASTRGQNAALELRVESGGE